MQLNKSLTVHGIPTDSSVIHKLRSLYPDTKFQTSVGFEIDIAIDSDVVGVWNWEAGTASLATEAGDLLKNFFLPITSHGNKFVIAFPFTLGDIVLPEANIHRLSSLDLEDILTILEETTETVLFENLSELEHRIPQTPIEKMLSKAMSRAGVHFEPQVRVGSYIPDFIVTTGSLRWVIEADGAGFHDRERDRQRDSILKGLGIEEVIRFTGSEIYRDADQCAADIKEAIKQRTERQKISELQQLDTGQLKAVQVGAGAHRVLAPAGSGKTRVLFNRVIELLNRGVDPSSILILAFNKQAEEQLNALLARAGVPRAKGVVGGGDNGVVCTTFNAFGSRYQTDLISGYFSLDKNGFEKGLMAEAVRRAGVNLSAMRLARDADPIDKFLKSLARVRAGLVDPHEEILELESFGQAPDPTVPFGPVHDAYSDGQINISKQTFDDQIYLTIKDLFENTNHRKRLQGKYEHVLVDEFQDLNGAQLALINVLSRPWRNLYVVGDDDQLIYGWRFAEVRNILDFHNNLPPEPFSSTHTLDFNYRSARRIVEASSRLISHNQDRVPKSIRPKEKALPGYLRFFRSDQSGDRLQEVVNQLSIDGKQEHRLKKWSGSAVLCRYKSQMALVAMRLDAERIPRSPIMASFLFRHRAARITRSYLEIISDSESASSEDFAAVLRHPNRYVTNEFFGSLEASDEPRELVRKLGDTNPDVGSLLRVIGALKSRFGAGHVDAKSVISLVLDETGLTRYWDDNSDRKSNEEQDDSGPLEILGSVGMTIGESQSLAEMLKGWDQRLDRERQDSSIRKDPNRSPVDEVFIGTIHAAKGREFNNVVLYDYQSKIPDVKKQEFLEEERRVMYVGVTRAIENLLITIDGDRKVHQFVKELILEPSPGEIHSIEEKLSRLIKRHRANSVEISNAKRRKNDVDSGEELRGIRLKFDRLSALIVTIENELASIEDQLQKWGFSRFKSFVSGERSRLKFERSKISDNLSELNVDFRAVESRFEMLNEDPETAKKLLAEEIKTAEGIHKKIEDEQAQLEDRRTEIGLLRVDDPNENLK
jgi:DNA helicase II / ATP-dependent DNA helicase PcrA